MQALDDIFLCGTDILCTKFKCGPLDTDTGQIMVSVLCCVPEMNSSRDGNYITAFKAVWHGTTVIK